MLLHIYYNIALYSLTVVFTMYPYMKLQTKTSTFVVPLEIPCFNHQTHVCRSDLLYTMQCFNFMTLFISNSLQVTFLLNCLLSLKPKQSTQEVRPSD